MLIFIILTHLLLIPNLVKANSFCNFWCGATHTACRSAQRCLVSGRCEEGQDRSLNDKMRNWVIEIHNKLRNKFAFDQQASNMNAISYSKEIEFVAQCWSNTCKTTHDLCRTTSAYRDLDQNIYVRSSSTRFPYCNKNEIETAIKIWFSDNKTTEQFIESKKINQHATHRLWSETKHVGCGCTTAKKNGEYLLYFYCNYGPPIDTTNFTSYIPGPPCSNCNGSCNEIHKGLCGEIENVRSDYWEPPYRFRRMDVLLRRSRTSSVSSLHISIFSAVLEIIFLCI